MTLTLLPGGNRDPTTEAFRTQVERFRRTEREKPGAPSSGQPGHEPSGYEMVTRQMVESIADDVRDIKSKITNLTFVLIGAVVIDIVSRALGQ